jgi:hypothetical protein
MAEKETSWDKVHRDVVAPEPRPKELLPILQDWVMRLGLRFQGVLLSAIRGCDTVQRHDHSKILARIYRAEILQTHAGDPAKSKSFIMWADIPTTVGHMEKFLNDCDHLPQHYVMHFLHAAEILGYGHPDPERRDMWGSFYQVACRKYHLRPETYAELIDRLEEKDEDTFHKNQNTTVRAHLFEENQARAKTAAIAKAEESLKQRRLHGEYGGS